MSSKIWVHFSFTALCDRLGLSKGRFYYCPGKSRTHKANEDLTIRIHSVFKAHKGRYGYRRIHEELQRQGVPCSRNRVRKLMDNAGLKASQPSLFRPKTSDGKASNPSPNLLKEIGFPDRPGTVLAGDFTYIRTATGFVYLAVVIDLYSRKVLGWSLCDNMKSNLVVEALDEAFNSSCISQEAVFHSDRGSQYGSGKFRKLLNEKNMRQSMSDRGNPYDNAVVESFFGTLKNELPAIGSCEDIDEVRREIFEYINTYYHNCRLHSSLGYRTPDEYEQMAFQE